jgi:hypothetical protein
MIQMSCDVMRHVAGFVVIDISKDCSSFTVNSGGMSFGPNIRHHKSTNTMSHDTAPKVINFRLKLRQSIPLCVMNILIFITVKTQLLNYLMTIIR